MSVKEISFAVGELTRLRAVRDDDLGALFETFADKRSFVMLHGAFPVSFDLAAAARATASGGDTLTWIIETLDESAVAGYVQTNFSRQWQGTYIVAIAVAPRFQKRRIGIDARIVHVKYLFEQLNARRVTGFYRADNEAAARMNARLGATICGRVPDAHYTDGTFCDLIPYSYSRASFTEKLGADYGLWKGLVGG